MKTIDQTLNRIKAIRKQLADIDTRLRDVRNNREYDAISAERALALLDLTNETAELNRVATIEYEISTELLSADADKIVDAEISKRVAKFVESFKNA